MRKRIVDEPLCPICVLEGETIFHAIWDCPASRDVWGASLRIFQKSTFPVSNFFLVGETMLDKGGLETFRVFLEIARRIWLRRNGWIYEGQFTHPNNIVHAAETAVHDYVLATKDADQRGAEQVERPVMWLKPDRDWAKVNMDATIDKGSGRIGLGIILRDHGCNFLAAKSAMRRGLWDPAAAEALVAYLRVHLA